MCSCSALNSSVPTPGDGWGISSWCSGHSSCNLPSHSLSPACPQHSKPSSAQEQAAAAWNADEVKGNLLEESVIATPIGEGGGEFCSLWGRGTESPREAGARMQFCWRTLRQLLVPCRHLMPSVNVAVGKVPKQEDLRDESSSSNSETK